jgi:hypothetical protein
MHPTGERHDIVKLSLEGFILGWYSLMSYAEYTHVAHIKVVSIGGELPLLQQLWCKTFSRQPKTLRASASKNTIRTIKLKIQASNNSEQFFHLNLQQNRYNYDDNLDQQL